MELSTAIKSFFKVLLNIDLRSGKPVITFEEQLEKLLKRSVVTIPNARYGLMRTLEYLKISEGDGVIMTPINLPDMKTIILNSGAQLRFIQYQPKSFDIDLESIEVRDSDKVFFYTPIAGIIPDMEAIKAFCEQHNLELIIDFTQSFLALHEETQVHLYSDYSFSSLCDLKVIHTHRGGIYTTGSQEFYNYLKLKEEELNAIDRRFFLMSILEDAISLTLLKPLIFKFLTRGVLKILSLKKGDNVEAITSGQGIKVLGFRFFKGFFQSNQVQRSKPFPSFLFYRFSDLQAKIGLDRLKKFAVLEKRRIKNAELFYESLSDLSIQGMPKNSVKKGNCYWKTPFWVRSPKEFKAFMGRWGVDCSQTNLPLLNEHENAQAISVEQNMRDNVIYMPTHWYLNETQIKEMANIVNEYFRIKFENGIS